jgi:replicative DNA helicase
VAESLDLAGEGKDTGGLAYLGELAANTPSAANIRRYAEIVRERAILRQLVTAGDEIAGSALNPLGRDPKTLLDEAERKVFAIAEGGLRHQTGFQHINPLLTQVVERIQELHDRDNPSDITGVPTGYHDLDSKTSGLQGGDLLIVAGRPSMGKTSFALNIAEHVAIEVGLPVAVFSMEMGGTQLAMRMLVLGGPARRASRTYRSAQRRRVVAPVVCSGQDARSADLHRRDAGAQSDRPARARAPPAPPVRPLGLIVIDYLQLMSGDRPRREPGDRDLGDFALAEEPGQGTECSR